MTEQEWLECADPTRMLAFLYQLPSRGGMSQRKGRLFACACIYRAKQFLKDERSRVALEVAEKYADGLASTSDLRVAAEGATQAFAAVDNGRTILIEKYGTSDVERLIALEEGGDYNLTSAVIFASMNGEWTDDPDEDSYSLQDALYTAEDAAYGLQNSKGQSEEIFAIERCYQTQIVREIFGNPFRRVVADPSWLTPTVVSLATAIYDERAFDRMPILADALTDAGCDNQDILQHCRSGQEHVRGCWVVDLVLGKS